MKSKLYQVDAFTEKLFGGNPAAVCVLENWISESLMQYIASENNLSETAFVVKTDNRYEIRWFTPVVEVDLCGHATLAAAYVLYQFYERDKQQLAFNSKSGVLKVTRDEEFLTLDFPVDILLNAEAPAFLVQAIGKTPIEIIKGKTDYLLIYKNQTEIEEISPDFNLLSKVDARGIIVSAPGIDSDFVSRFFCPCVGFNEDPVTGSAHTTLTPYWSKKLNKSEMVAVQLSKRRGYLKCKLAGDRVQISGKAKLYLEGEIIVE